jgi:predicted DNA-binding protein (UPF0251 family)
LKVREVFSTAFGVAAQQNVGHVARRAGHATNLQQAALERKNISRKLLLKFLKEPVFKVVDAFVQQIKNGKILVQTSSINS